MQDIERALMIGDIAGHDAFHVGDEAMLEANLGLLQRLAPGALPTLVSLDPTGSTRTYGIPAVARIGFTSVSPDRAAELARIDALVAQAIAGEDPIPDAFRVLLESDLLVISGGGNLSSTWPEHILERLALVRLARARGLPIMILGQTLGPNLTLTDRSLVAEILAAAFWVGLREAPSVALAIGLGVPLDKIDYLLDDSIFLEGQPIEPLWPRAADGSAFPRVIALTLHPFVDPASDAPLLDLIARELDRVIAATDAHLLFLPHVRQIRGGVDFGDRAVGEALARRLARPEAMTVLDVRGARETAWLTRQADMVLSSRYHPLIFGLAAAKPCLALPTDDYTHIKLQGALIHAGAAADLLPIERSSITGLADRVMATLARGPETQARLGAAVAGWRDAEADRERRLSLALHSGMENGVARNGRLIQALATALTSTGGDDPGGWKRRDQVRLLDHWRATAEEAVAYARSLEATAEEAIKYARSLEGAYAALTQERDQLAERLKPPWRRR